MRSADIALLVASLPLLFLPADGRSQEQERKLEDRLLRPDMTLQSDFQSKRFNQTAGFSVRSSAHSKSFGYSRNVNPGSFNTRLFLGAKGFGESKKTAESKTANTAGKYASFDGDRSYGTRPVETDTPHDSGRSYGVDAYGTREFRPDGKSQKSLDRRSAKMKDLTIDQVRELLNKNQ
jgi:hypothetical protein